MDNSQEKNERIQVQLQELKEGIEAARKKLKADKAKQKVEFNKSVDEAAAMLKKFNAETMDRLENELEELSKQPDISAKMIEAQENENNAVVMGDIEAAKENVRIAKEYSDSKWNSALLQAQMNVNEIKARRAQRLEEMDKTDRAAYINYLLDYADDCETMAESFMLEAQLALAEAVNEIQDYQKEYGEPVSVS